MNDMSPGVKRGRKFEQVLQGAREVFLAEGFEGASVDIIAKKAGVSKATLYSYFPDKKLLFLEVAKSECSRQANMAQSRIDMTGPPEDVLYEAASQMVRFFLSDFGRAMYRTCVAEAARFPEIGREFYASGPEVAQKILTAFLRDSVARGYLVIPEEDLSFAADQFRELCKASLHVQMVMGVRSEFSDAEIDRVVLGAVEMFVARYGAARPGAVG